MDYRTMFSTRRTPQAQPIPGTAQVANSAGGHAWAVDDWTRLRRFLILGSEGGTFYIAERTLTIENAEAVARCLDADGPRAVAEIAEVSRAGRAAKNDPALFALAMAAGLGDAATRRAALAALPEVARTGTHLLHFAHFAEGFRGWGRGLREAIAAWYNRLDAGALAYQLVKYQNRDGWTHRDLLRLAHVKPADEPHRALFGWVTRGRREGLDGTLVEVFERMKRVTGAAEASTLIGEHRLTWEMVPTELLAHAAVWEALLPHMPLTALLRNLGRMTALGVLASHGGAARRVAAQLASKEALRRARVHPLAVLAALRVYGAGRGFRGKLSWKPVRAIVDALDAAFYTAFGAVEPTGARLVLALDVSGSMGYGLASMPFLTCRDGAAAMALVTAAVESRYTMVAFSDGTDRRRAHYTATTAWAEACRQTPERLVELSISPRQRLDDVTKAMSSLPFGGTDCALPMLWALEKGVEADAFVIYTDSETWHGDIHPVQALRECRRQTGIAARLVVVGMVSNGFSIADPDDAGMLDVVGFDTATPNLIGEFVAGRV